MDHSTLLIVLACVFGIFMAWGVGANDVANAMGTSVGSRALTIKHAILIAAIFEFSGAFLAGGEVTKTISGGITKIEYFQHVPQLLVYGMLSSLLASGTWLAIASYFGWPVSTTHSIIGAIVGFTSVGVGFDAVHWSTITSIALSWLVSPLCGGVVSFLLFTSVQRLILSSPNPFAQAKRYVPFYMFLAGFVVSIVTLQKGLKHLHLEITLFMSLVYSVALGLVVMGIGALLLRRIQLPPNARSRQQFFHTERIFAILMIFTACTMAFAHGSNDVANAVGPMAAVISAVTNNGDLAKEVGLSPWVLLVGGLGIVFGLFTYGHKVIATVGTGITELTPSRGFAAELAAASTVVWASGLGLPISTTHTLVGAVLGVGLARGIGAINLDVVRSIALSWFITLPAGAFLSIIFFYMFKIFLG
jgi:PiT family inorganic phosphate transporter